MFSIDVECRQAEKDLTVAELWDAGSIGIVELEDWDDVALLRAFYNDDAQIPMLETRFRAVSQPADNRDWVAFAREHLKPMEIGRRIYVCPEWRSDSTPEGRIRIEVNAGLAFGTGAHETTRLCLEAIERRLKPGDTVLDVGTGSGILAEAAAKLGAGRVLACDTDAEAVNVARGNTQRAAVDISFVTGSVEAWKSGLADLVAANISPAWVADLAAEWVRVLRPSGTAILSGFEEADLESVTAAIKAAGGRVELITGENTWRAIEVAALVG